MRVKDSLVSLTQSSSSVIDTADQAPQCHFLRFFFYNLKREIHKISYTLFHDSNSIEPKIHRQNHLCVEVHGCDFFILKNHTDNTKSSSAVSLKPWSQTTLCH